MSNFTELKNKYELAQFLEVSLKTLNFLTIHKSAKKYLVKEIPKKTGGVRKLYIPNKKLKEIQKMIAQELSALYKPRNCAFAYIKGRNIKNNAEKHLNKRWVLRLDLKDFFETIHFGRVRGIFIHLGFLPEVANVLAQLCTYEGILPQGSPTSPVISNIIASGLDKDLSSLAKKNNCFYTRYSDDLYFSCNRKNFPKDLAYFKEDGSNSSCQIGDFLRVELENHGFYLNDKKTYLADNSSRKYVTGIVVNQKLNVNKSFIRELRVLIHKCELDADGFYKKYLEEKKKNIFSVLKGKVEFLGFIRGYDDFLYLKNALKILRSRGLFTSLDVEFREDLKGPDGDSGLLAQYKAALERNHEDDFLSLFVFDKDAIRTISTLESTKNKHPLIRSYQYLVILEPLGWESRPDVINKYCIEHMYMEKDIAKIRDEFDRRLYFKHEFNSHGFHEIERVVYISIKDHSLVADKDVYSIDTQASIALTKKNFAQLVNDRFFNEIDYTNFERFFREIERMKNEFYSGS